MDFIAILNEAFHLLVPLAIILGISALALFLNAKKKEVKAKSSTTKKSTAKRKKAKVAKEGE